MTPEELEKLRDGSVDSIVEGLDDLSDADLAALKAAEEEADKPRATLIASIEKAITARSSPDTGSDDQDKPETPVSDEAVEKAKAEEVAANKAAEQKKLEELKARMLEMDCMKPDYSEGVTIEVAGHRNKFEELFGERPWDKKIQTK